MDQFDDAQDRTVPKKTRKSTKKAVGTRLPDGSGFMKATVPTPKMPMGPTGPTGPRMPAPRMPAPSRPRGIRGTGDFQQLMGALKRRG